MCIQISAIASAKAPDSQHDYAKPICRPRLCKIVDCILTPALCVARTHCNDGTRAHDVLSR